MPAELTTMLITIPFLQLIPYLIEMQAKGSFPLEKIVTTYDAKDFAGALEDVKQTKTIKAVLKW